MLIIVLFLISLSKGEMIMLKKKKKIHAVIRSRTLSVIQRKPMRIIENDNIVSKSS